MRFKLVKKIAVGAALSALTVGGIASSASASEELLPPAVVEQSQDVAALTYDDLPAPDGVSDAEWSEALDEAKAEFGMGDKAYVEAMKEVAPLQLSYCTSYENITPGNGAWYKIPRSGGNYDCILESGNVSVAVTVLQQSLNACYGTGLVVDGDFGGATYNALLNVQSAEGIGVDGIYGPMTRSNIKWWGGGSICTYGWQIGL